MTSSTWVKPFLLTGRTSTGGIDQARGTHDQLDQDVVGLERSSSYFAGVAETIDRCRGARRLPFLEA